MTGLRLDAPVPTMAQMTQRPPDRDVGRLVDALMSELAVALPHASRERVLEAFRFADEAHRGQDREDGAPYITHPIQVARYTLRFPLDEDSVCAALLHDVVEDCDVSLDEIEERFGPVVRGFVDGLTKLKGLQFRSREHKQAENFRKFAVAMSRDPRVLLVKLCDRLHNMQTLGGMASPEKRRRKAQETLTIYAPLANRLGLHWLKSELEDLSFKHLYPDEYRDLAQKLQKTRAQRMAYRDRVVEMLGTHLRSGGLDCEVSGRPKHLYSIWRKMQKQDLPFEQIYDLMAFRVIVEAVPDCYVALGHVHALWRPLPGRFKDYISNPKRNGYRSLHTTVFGPNEQRIEVQIRTRAMHRQAESGIAAHWRYKEGGGLDIRDEQRFAWLRQIITLCRDADGPGAFLEDVRTTLFDDVILVLTPRGDVLELPRGATPIDFAYAIHTEVGNHCRGARIQDRGLVPLSYQLQDGDVVEVITAANQHPREDWLRLVKTPKARHAIRRYLRSENRRMNVEMGRQLLERAMRSAGLSLTRFERRKDLGELLEKLGSGLNAVDDLYARVGAGRVSASDVVDVLREETQARRDTTLQPTFIERVRARLGRKQTTVRVGGLDGTLYVLAKCCSPVPGDEIVAFTTRARGFTIHRRNCPHVEVADLERILDAEWAVDATQGLTVTLRIVTVNRPGLLAAMSDAFSQEEVNIVSAECRAINNAEAVNYFEVEVDNLAQLNRVIRRIRGLRGVHSVERVRR